MDGSAGTFFLGLLAGIALVAIPAFVLFRAERSARAEKEASLARAEIQLREAFQALSARR